jgi:hypothetical protein
MGTNHTGASGATLVLAVSLAASRVLAFNPESTLLSPDAALTGAVLASDDDGGGGWYNPASLGAVTRNSLRLGISAYAGSFFDAERIIVTVTPWRTQEQALNSFRFNAVPSVLGLTWKLRDGLGLSLGVWTPFRDSLSAGLDTTDSGPMPGSPGIMGRLQQRYDWVESADDTWGVASLGWQVHPTLRLGASLQGGYSTAERWIELNSTVRPESGPDGGTLLHVRLHDRLRVLALRASLGAQWIPTPRLRFALVVRSPTVQLFRSLDRVRIVFSGAQLPGEETQTGGVIESAPRSSSVSLIDPPRVLAGAQLELGAVSLRLDGEWSPGSVSEGLTLQPGLRVRAGALYPWSKDLTVGLGATYDAPRLVAAEGHLAVHVVSLQGGATMRSTDVVKALGGSDSWDLLSTIAVGAALGFGKAPGVVVAPLALEQSVLPLLLDTSPQRFEEVPARIIDFSVHFMSTLKF